jgi:hypothetical protein
VSAKRLSGISATLEKTGGVCGVAFGSCPVSNRFSTSSEGCHIFPERQSQSELAQLNSDEGLVVSTCSNHVVSHGQQTDILNGAQSRR